MKKALIALALMSIAGTAFAKNVQVQAEVFSGREHLKTFSVVVEDGKLAEIKDKELPSHFGSTPAILAAAGPTSADHQAEEQTSEPSFLLKMTPRILLDGQILVDAEYTLTTLVTTKVLHDGVEQNEPVTRIKSVGTQMIAGKSPSKLPDEFPIKSGDLIVIFSAIEVL